MSSKSRYARHLLYACLSIVGWFTDLHQNVCFSAKALNMSIHVHVSRASDPSGRRLAVYGTPPTRDLAHSLLPHCPILSFIQRRLETREAREISSHISKYYSLRFLEDWCHVSASGDKHCHQTTIAYIPYWATTYSTYCCHMLSNLIRH